MNAQTIGSSDNGPSESVSERQPIWVSDKYLSTTTMTSIAFWRRRRCYDQEPKTWKKIENGLVRYHLARTLDWFENQ